MSFILDALKKSELERQRQSVPGLVDSGVARPRSRLPAWAIALALLLAVNLLVLLFVLTRSLLASSHAPAAAGKESQVIQPPAVEPRKDLLHPHPAGERAIGSVDQGGDEHEQESAAKGVWSTLHGQYPDPRRGDQAERRIEVDAPRQHPGDGLPRP